MKSQIIVVVILAMSLFSACSMFGGRGNLTNTNNSVTNNTLSNNTKSSEFTGEVNFPFDFPSVDTTAKAGEYVLVPSFNCLVEAIEKGGEKTTMIWSNHKMSKPGAEKSEILFMGEKKGIPNAYIIPIPAGEKAKKGEIVLTWWQTGSGLQRAIVTEDTNPTEPIVRYLDLEYGNPAKSRDGKTTIGQMDEKLKPDSFVVIKDEFEPGTSVAIKDREYLKHGQIIREADDKVFVKLFGSSIGVFSKSEVLGVPIRPGVEVGDSVKAVNSGNFVDGTVSKVDAAIGRVWVKFSSSGKEVAIAFGDVMPK